LSPDTSVKVLTRIILDIFTVLTVSAN